MKAHICSISSPIGQTRRDVKLGSRVLRGRPTLTIHCPRPIRDVNDPVLRGISRTDVAITCVIL